MWERHPAGREREGQSDSYPHLYLPHTFYLTVKRQPGKNSLHTLHLQYRQAASLSCYLKSLKTNLLQTTSKETSCTSLTHPPPNAQLPSSTVICEGRVHFPAENVALVCVLSWLAPEALDRPWLFVDITLRTWMYKNICLSLRPFQCEPWGFLRSQTELNRGFECEGWRTYLINLPNVPSPCRSPGDRRSDFHFSQNTGLLRTSYHMGFERIDLKVIINWTVRCSCTIYMIFQLWDGWLSLKLTYLGG